MFDKRNINVIDFQTIDSTNLELKRRNAPAGTVVTALNQSNGRGRLGRSFSSPSGGLYISFCIEMDSSMTATAKAAVAVSHAAEEAFGIDLKIKWLNDLTLDGRKVCGILAEAMGDRMIIGIGVNVCTPSEAFPPELRNTAGSLFKSGAPENAVQLFKQSLISCFFDDIDSDCLGAYRSRLSTITQTVNVIQAGQMLYQGIASGLTDDYHLLVRTPDGEIHEIRTGEVTIRNAP
ncbi:MAG: biotin--[acetyl-CoA-carboxylase] ligase [Sphaerochaetaceae bacterium]